ncbi:protein NUCLEAR FUSION DEFECTIVE 4-like [Curcuma longa]|uniref:protein NUCLEAR FUSION DEFECTIVE 4-like n=1 Tax=Curcuma longa TaxID=136217 RepID=UPI003D9EA71D
MEGQSRKWMVAAATVWIQAFTGTNFDFSAYSSDMKAVMRISQVQLNYLATASDLGKALGWSSGLALLYLPLPVVLLLAAAIGVAAYGAQWLLITGRISLSYFPVFLLCLLAGCSICWFNTVCFVLCIRNFSLNRSLALGLTISFNGLSASLYALAANAVSSSSSSTSAYLLLNAALPLLASTAALLPILRSPSSALLLDSSSHDSHIFVVLHILAFFTGLYLLFLNSFSSSSLTNARLLLAGAVILLLLPACVPHLICACDWLRRNIYSSSLFSFIGGAVDDFELQKQLVGSDEEDSTAGGNVIRNDNDCDGGGDDADAGQHCCSCRGLMKDKLAALGEEHSVSRLVRRIDFWLYYVAYFCGATVGLVYSNNLGQIAESLGKDSQTTTLITVYSSCSFFGRLLSSAPDFLREKIHFARTGWLAVAVVPLPVAFFLLAESGDALLAGTALIGLSSGFIFSAAVSVTSELFGSNGLGVNHNILITNIPLGSLLYGLLAALIYDANGKTMVPVLLRNGMVVCMGRKCYAKTFLWWACISLVSLASSLALYFRTKALYRRAARRRPRPPPAGEQVVEPEPEALAN